MNDFGEFDALRVALIEYYGNGKIGSIADHLPVGAEMVDSRYIRYQGQTERLDQWCRRLDVYNAPKSYNVKGNYQSRVHSSKTISTPDLPKRSRRPLASFSDEELVDLAKKTADRFNKAIDEARIIGSEYGIDIQVSEDNVLNLVFAKLKERRDTVTKESVEKDLQIAIGKLTRKGEYMKVTELTNLFVNEHYKKVREMLDEIL